MQLAAKRHRVAANRVEEMVVAKVAQCPLVGPPVVGPRVLAKADPHRMRATQARSVVAKRGIRATSAGRTIRAPRFCQRTAIHAGPPRNQ